MRTSSPLARGMCFATFLVSACSGSEPLTPDRVGADGGAQSSRVDGGPSADAGGAPKTHAGGMWMPNQLPLQEEVLRRLGWKGPIDDLASPLSPLLGSVVSLGGCTATFVSKTGLLLTNHHCATGALQYNSTPSSNLLKDGFLATSLADERSNGPKARVFVTQAITDVTDAVRGAAASEATPLGRYRALEAAQKALTSECERGRPEIRCSVVPFYDGAMYYKIEQLELRDIRLVHAPPASIGNFGGEVDNWRWPRHTGDYAFFRAYVGKDGKPSDFSRDNVPFVPKHVARLTTEPLREGDFVLVAGYPARTQYWKPAEAAREAERATMPWRLALCNDYISTLEALTEKDKALAIKAASMLRGLHNLKTNLEGQLSGFSREALVQKKLADKSALASLPDSGRVLDAIAEAYDSRERSFAADAAVRELASMVRLVDAGVTIARMASERQRPDADRHPSFQDRMKREREQAQVALEKQYHPTLDKAALKLAVRRARTSCPATGSALDAAKAAPASALCGLWRSVVPKLRGNSALSEERIITEVFAWVDDAYAKTKLASEKERLLLLATATPASLRRSADPLVVLAQGLAPLIVEAEQRDQAFQGTMSALVPKYLELTKARAGGAVAPDANSTLRVSFGTVRPYKPSPSAPMHAAFTRLPEIVKKSTGKEPFDSPPLLLTEIGKAETSRYVDAALGTVPVNFLSDLHITGGNSGSGTFDAKGALTGLVFDGNYEALLSDWLYMPEITRAIHVDLRYILWLLENVVRAPSLLRELGVPAGGLP